METLAPESISDRLAIQKLAQQGEIFSVIDRQVVLQGIVPRILQVQGRIPSFRTFFEDTIYLEALIKSLRPLLPTPQPRLRRDMRPTFRQAYYRCFTDVGQSRDIVKIETGEDSFRSVSGRIAQRKELGYLMMFLAAMRDFPVLSQTAPHRSHGEKKLVIEGSIMERQSYLALLALNLGFDSPQIRALAKDDPNLAAARGFIQRSRPSDRYELDIAKAEALARYIATELRAIANPIHLDDPATFSCYSRVPKKLRYGLPDNINHTKDRRHLFLDTIYNYGPPFGQHLTSLAFQRDIFVCFFGTPSIPSELSRPTSYGDSGDEGEYYPSHVGPESEMSNPITDTGENGVVSVSDTSHLGFSPSSPARGAPPRDRRSRSNSSNYDARKSSGLLSEPASDFSGYLRTIEAAVWPHSQVSSNIAGEYQIMPLAPGFEQTVGREMNMFHMLDDNVRPSEAVTQFLSGPTILVVYLWNERKYIKFWPTQRDIYEDTACTLAECNMCFAFFHDNEVEVTGLADLWAKAHDTKLILAGPKSTSPQSHDVARSLDSFLQWIDH